MAHFRTVSAVAAGLMALATLPSTQARADGPVLDLGGTPPLSNLVRFEERDYRIETDSSVSLEATSETSVTKIGYGVTTQVNVATTSSGTYSSDGLTSPYVLYPGITVTPERSARSAEIEIGFGFGGSGLGSGRGGSSFLSVFSSPDGDFIFLDTLANGFASCHLTGSFTHCFSR